MKTYCVHSTIEKMNTVLNLVYQRDHRICQRKTCGYSTFCSQSARTKKKNVNNWTNKYIFNGKLEFIDLNIIDQCSFFKNST